LTLVAAESGRRYNDSDLALATELARRAALAVDNARLHQESVDARRQAENANRAKTEFLAVMSHELRTPLNAIAGYADLLRLGLRGPLSAPQDEFIERIQRSERHLLSLINDVLNFAKLEAGHVEYEVSDVAMRGVISEMDALILPQVAQNGLTFSCTDCSDTLHARGDAEKIRQVLLNLLSNAIKFTAAGGSISLACEASGDRVLIRVSDTGVGIPPDKLETIFEPFVQLGSGLTERQAGTGLGLAISRDLARGMGGDLRAESRLGQGSVFTLSLARADVPTLADKT
jgi:signal transduction histidine kinase